jgi:hypothetical protein
MYINNPDIEQTHSRNKIVFLNRLESTEKKNSAINKLTSSMNHFMQSMSSRQNTDRSTDLSRQKSSQNVLLPGVKLSRNVNTRNSISLNKNTVLKSFHTDNNIKLLDGKLKKSMCKSKSLFGNKSISTKSILI